MKDRSLFVLLAITVAFILYVKPARENSDLLQTRIALLDSQIAAQQNIRRQRREIDGRLKATGVTASANEGYLYPASKSNSLALVDLQDFVKVAAAACRMEIVSSNWGEATVDPKSGLVRIPMTFMLKGMPGDLDGFLQRLLYGRRFIKVERATISRLQDQQLMVNVSLVAFKRDGTHE